MDYMLRQSLSKSDIDFLNATSVEFEIINTHGLKPETNVFDSGWRDMSTDARIISDKDRAVFRYVNETDYLMLLLKFGDRLKELTVSLTEVYNIAYAHNTDAVNVFDSK